MVLVIDRPPSGVNWARGQPLCAGMGVVRRSVGRFGHAFVMPGGLSMLCALVCPVCAVVASSSVLPHLGALVDVGAALLGARSFIPGPAVVGPFVVLGYQRGWAAFALALAFAAFAFHLALAAHVLALARDNNVCYMQRPAIANSNCPNDKRGSGAELNSNGTFSQHGLITVGVRSTVKSFRSVSACVPTVCTSVVFLPDTGYQQLG